MPRSSNSKLRSSLSNDFKGFSNLFGSVRPDIGSGRDPACFRPILYDQLSFSLFLSSL